LIFVSRITPCIVGGIVCPLFTFSILSDTTVLAFSFAVDRTEESVMNKQVMKPMNERSIWVKDKLDRHVYEKRKINVTCFITNTFTDEK